MTNLNTLFQQFQTQLQTATTTELVDALNREVGNSGWTSARSAFLLALRDEMLRRAWNCDAIRQGDTLSLATRIRLNPHTLAVELMDSHP